MPRFTRWCCFVLCWTSLALPAQNLVPNPSFELGNFQPTNWVNNNSVYCNWDSPGRTSLHAASVTNYNDNCNGMQWRSAAFAVQPGKPYLVNVWAVCSNGTEVARAQIGLGTPGNFGVNDRFIYPPANWAAFPYVALVPRNQNSLILRLLSCQGAGTIGFDDVDVSPIEPAHALDSGSQLGVGESVSPGKYRFSPNLRDLGQGYYVGNYARPAYDCTAYYSPYYFWYLSGGTQFTYRHEYGGKLFTNAVAKVISGYSGGGTLTVEFSVDGTNWLMGTNYSPGAVGYVTYTNVAPVPAGLLPSTNLFVRVQTSANSLFLVTGYSFEGDMPGNSGSAAGASLLFAQRVPKQFVDLSGLANGSTQLQLALQNANGTDHEYLLQWNVQGPAGAQSWSLTNMVSAGATSPVTLPFTGMGWGENTLNVEVKDLTAGTTNFSGWTVFFENVLHDASYGRRLPDEPNCAVWWCEGAYKVGRERALPLATNAWVEVAAARNDYEPFQIILRPNVSLSNVIATISDLFPEDTNNLTSIAATNVEFNIVDYVPIITPTDTTCVTGDHPDPLLPWTSPAHFAAGSNQPVWGTIYVPKTAPGGYYTALVTIQHDAGSFNVPVRLRVFNFTLPEVNHTRAAIHTGVDDYWHASTNSSLKPAIYDLYMQNFRKHRVAPLKPHNYAPMTWTQVSGLDGISYQFNFTNFDATIERYIGEFGFNVLRLDAEIVPNSLNGQPRFTPAYRDLYRRFMEPVMAHLREKGWLRDSYLFWIDEPSATIVTDTVVPGMQAIGDAAPGLRRFLTREPVPELYGLVDIWSPWVPWLVMSQMPVRRAYGEGFWWYVSGGPGYPYAMYFSDYPAVHPRLRFWQGEKFGFDGEAYFNTVWWIGTLHAPINPWTNTLTHLFDGSSAGNGNGVLLYPPTKIPPTSPLVAPPINSLRWEMVREGIEDREFFWLLDQCLQRREPALGANHPAVVQAKNARAAALGTVLSRTYYDTDPQKIYAGRLAVAEAIEALDDGAPFMVREPLSQAALAGSNVVLRAEAVGWPLPAYQWRHEGTNVAGATSGWLTMSNFGPANLGAWQLVASNQFGVATSSVANLAGYWVTTPQIISFSPGDVRRFGDRTVLEVTAVSALPMTYRWYLNGVLLAGVTNNAWAITNLTAANGGYYTVTVSNAAGLATSAPMAMILPPILGTQPISQTVAAGDTLSLVSSAAGPLPLNYMWVHDGVPLMPPVNSAVLTLTNVQATQAGNYYVVISNAAGAVTSAVASVTVLLPPQIVIPPTNQTAFASHRAEFSVLGSGPGPLAYQWFFNATNLLAGATNQLLTLTNVQTGDAGGYTVVLSNVAGAVTSSIATLVVLTPSQLIEPPSLVVVEGSNATFTATTTGIGPANYLWYFNDTTFLPNGNSPVLMLTNVQATQAGGYHVVISTASEDITSAAAILTVLVPPKILEPPTNTTAIAGHDQSLRVVGAGTAPLAYQWFFNATNSLANATNDLLWITNVSAATAGDYVIVLTNVVGAVTSPVAKLTVLVPPHINETPSNLTVNVGANAQFFVTASGTAPLNYRWYFDEIAALPGATTPQLLLTNIQTAQAGSYLVLITNVAGSVTSAPAWLMVMPNYTSEPPTFSGNWAGLTNGFELLLPVDNRTRAVLVSTNLSTWSTQFLLGPSGLPQVLMDSAATNSSRQFYRVRAN